jgi:hypothetical protein
MAVDRNARDAVSDILVAFLRCEADLQATIDKVEAYCQDHNEDATNDTYLKELLESLWAGLSRDGLSQRWWEAMRRELAFLQTDLQKPEWPPYPPGPPDTLPFVYWHLLALSAALALSWFAGWWLFIGVWAAAGTFGMVHFQLQDHGTAGRAEWSRLLAYHPFLNEEEWLAHEKLLDRFQLPTYEVWRQKNWIEPSRLREAASSVVFWTVIPAMLAFMFASSVAMWPLFVVLFSISELFRRKKQETAQE